MTLPLLSTWPAVADAEPPRPLRLCALDLSLQSTGTAATHTPDGRTGLTVTTIRTRTDGDQRIDEILTGVAHVTRFMPQLVLIERLPNYTGHGSVPYELAELHGNVKRLLYTFGIPYLMIWPPHLKIYATGKGDGRGIESKRAVLRAMQTRYAVYVETFDEADALAMLTLALHAYGQPVADVPDTHHRAVGKVTWPDLPELARGAHLTPRADLPPVEAAMRSPRPAASGSVPTPATRKVATTDE
ncbi:MAG TPA: hypothetical protein VFC00_40705 [Micromonosporaceae bacterium]|nr:hypothetical protein [Micromonosporaceae bacterium]